MGVCISHSANGHAWVEQISKYIIDKESWGLSLSGDEVTKKKEGGQNEFCGIGLDSQTSA